jgi:hypothetical protein
MANAPIGDTRVRRRITTVIGDVGYSSGTFSRKNPDISFCDKHYVTIVIFGTVSGGTVTIRALPVNGAGSYASSLGPPIHTKIGIESVNLADVTAYAFEVNGFYESFEVTINSSITGGGKILVVVNSLPTT